MPSIKYTKSALPIVAKLSRRRRRSHGSLRRKRSIIIIHRTVRSQTQTSHDEEQKYDSSVTQRDESHVNLSVGDIKQISHSLKRTNSLGNIHDLVVNRKVRQRRRQYSRYVFLCIICCILCIIALVMLLFALLFKSKMTATTAPSRLAKFNINMLINGDAETGSCQMGSSVTSPTGWNHNGSITQNHYNNTIYSSQTFTTPGPSDRGNCYFSGQISEVTTMWQTIDLNNYVDPFLIDSSIVRFNLSAWIGGLDFQDDTAVVSLIFLDQFNQIIGNRTSIGPILIIDRGGLTSLLFRQANGLVPVSTRSFTVIVAIIRAAGTVNNGNVDNISVSLY